MISHLGGMFRHGSRVYTSRPPANCYSARRAWDWLSSKGRPAIKTLRLLDGFWCCARADGSTDDCENVFRLAERRNLSTPNDEAGLMPASQPSTPNDE